MAIWDNWFGTQPAQLTEEAKAITQTPAFKQAWQGWTPNYQTSTQYNPSTAVWGATTPQERPDIYSVGGYDIYNNPLSTSNPWNVLGRTQQDQGGISASDQAMINYKLQELAQSGQYNQQQLAMAREKMQNDARMQANQLAWEKERWGQELAQEQKNYMAQLGANPRSWLEYASAAGTTPVVQPWMLPLMSQQYGITGAGQQIPGWNAGNMSGMPNLTTPSAQYAARMGPTANAQYQGYEQALTGQTPEETQWRLWNMAPPSGGGSLTQTR